MNAPPISEAVTIVEVAPRDGFQSVKEWIPIEKKLQAIDLLCRAGCERMEIGAFVSPKALPQMADIEDIVHALPEHLRPGAAALVPNARGGERAAAAGLRNIVYVISVSESHNLSNVRRTVDESFADFNTLLNNIDLDGMRLRFDLSTCFHCPFEGRIDESRVLNLIERALNLNSSLEIGICDTTGRAMPDHVRGLFELLFRKIDSSAERWAFHGHDTYGLGICNNIQAYEAGVRIFDTAAAGLGGCPYAPGAKGNTATEDLVFVLNEMGVETGIRLDKLLQACDFIADLDPLSAGGRIRHLSRELVTG